MPKFPDILLNNNPNAPSLDLNNLQVKGVGIFADAAARDALDSNLHTEGYLAIMKDTDTPFIYTGGTWTDAANWKEVKGAWEEVAGTTTDIRYLNGSVGVTTSAGLTEYDTGTGTVIGHIRSRLGSTFPGSGQETVLHLHGGNLAISKVSGNGSNNFITLINGYHNISSGGYIGLRNYDMELGGAANTKITHYDTSGNLVGTRLLIASSDTPYGVPPKFDPNGLWFPGGILGSPDMKITMGGSDSGLQFYTHTSGVFHFMGLGVENSNYAAGIYLGTVQSGKVAYIRSSDSNTAGSYGYVGINVNNPSASGPAFEVSSSYGQFNTGLRVANSASIATMQVQGGQVLFTSVADGIWLQSVYNTTAGVSIGYQALASGGPGSVAIGNQLRSPNSGTVVLGYSSQAMTAWTATDPRSVLIGHSAGMTATTASDIIAIGNGPLSTLTSGSGNTAIGRTAGSQITTESNNTFVGYEAGRLVTGDGNTFIGMQAGELSTSMSHSTFIGTNAGRTSSGSYAVSIGYNSGVSGVSAISILGSATGDESIAIGGSSQVLASRGLAIGFEAHAKTGQDLVIGNRTNKYSFEAASTGNNVLIGHSDRSVLGPNNVMLGNSFVLNRGSTGMGTTPPTRNVAVGHSHFNNDPANVNSNIAVGGALFSTQDGAEIAYNVVLSYDVGNNDGGSNFQGDALRNVVIGYQAGHSYDLGSDNIFIGYQAARNETGSNKLYISNSSTTTPLMYGEFDNNLLRVNGNLQRMVFGGTETTTSGTIHIRDNTNWATQADATDNTASTGLLGVAQGSQANAGLVLFGDVDYTIAGNIGTPVYLDTTAGGFTTTAPSASGNIVRVMGYIIGSNKIFFNPSNDWLEIV